MEHIGGGFALKIFNQEGVSVLLCLQQIGIAIESCTKNISIYTSRDNHVSTAGSHAGCSDNCLPFSVRHNVGRLTPLVCLLVKSETAMMHYTFHHALG